MPACLSDKTLVLAPTNMHQHAMMEAALVVAAVLSDVGRVKGISTVSCLGASWPYSGVAGDHRSFYCLRGC